MYADADAVVRIAQVLMMRSASLVSAALAGVINANCSLTTKKSVTISGNNLPNNLLNSLFKFKLSLNTGDPKNNTFSKLSTFVVLRSPLKYSKLGQKRE